MKYENHVVIIIIILLTFFIVGATTYSAYIFINISQINDAAGVHIVSNIRESHLYQNRYNNSKNGIENWYVYKNEKEGFEAKYPSDWTLKKSDSQLFLIKKIQKEGSSESLAATIVIDKVEDAGKNGLTEYAKSSFAGIDNMQLIPSLKGKKALIFDFREQSGLSGEGLLIDNHDGIFKLVGTYYTQENTEFVEVFDKMILEFSII